MNSSLLLVKAIMYILLSITACILIAGIYDHQTNWVLLIIFQIWSDGHLDFDPKKTLLVSFRCFFQ